MSEAMQKALLQLKQEMLKKMFSKKEPTDLVNQEKKVEIEISSEPELPEEEKKEEESEDDNMGLFDKILKETIENDVNRRQKIQKMRPKADMFLENRLTKAPAKPKKR